MSLHERLVAAALGAVWGALIGLALAWLLGVYSNTLGPGRDDVGALSSWAGGGALLFGVLGGVFGVSVGTLIGRVIAWLFEFERNPASLWWAVLLMALLIAGSVVFR